MVKLGSHRRQPAHSSPTAWSNDQATVSFPPRSGDLRKRGFLDSVLMGSISSESTQLSGLHNTVLLVDSTSLEAGTVPRAM